MSTPATTPTRAAPAGGRRRPWGQLALPAVLVAVGVAGVVDARTITVPISASSVGPRAVPYAVGALLVVTGLLVAVDVLRGRAGQVEDGEDVDADRSVDWRAVLGLTASFAVMVVLIEPLGWPVAGTVLFAGVALSLGARSPVRATLVAAVLAVTVHVVFTQGLGVFLPAGPLEGVPGFG
jgi:putative tricarboxylic transport membrane protein